MSESHYEKLCRQVGLVLAEDGHFTITRQIKKDEVFYLNGDKPVKAKHWITRFNSLAVPPTYKDVIYSKEKATHIQAKGIDGSGKLQYFYHEKWTEIREATKRDHLIDCIEALPKLRRFIRQTLEKPDDSKAFAFAVALALIDYTGMRPGSHRYFKARKTIGAVTLQKKNVTVDGNAIRLHYIGKAGKEHDQTIEDDMLADAIRFLMKKRGRTLIRYKSRTGRYRSLSGSELSQYLKDLTDYDISAKDLRTLKASSYAIHQLFRQNETISSKKALVAVVKKVAVKIGNTPAVARNSYIHGAIMKAFDKRKLKKLVERTKAAPYVKKEEKALQAILEKSS